MPTSIALAVASLIAAASLISAHPEPAHPAVGINEPAPVAERLAFDFKDPKGVNGLGFVLDSTLEPFFGTGTAISGTVEFDPEDPTSAAGKLVMEAKSLRMTNERMTAVLHGADWMDVASHPEITVTLVKVAAARPIAENTFEILAEVEIGMKGRTVAQQVPIRATYLPGRLGDRVPNMKGDLLVLRSRFTVKRSDFELKPDASAEVVANEIQITAAITGVRKAE
ncbi:MAG TPA: YceI family protein [Phycisphaerales bacterium]|nr:YceI family protein [Phycisphaerales bacterium]HMP36248.1 YceI family protein [Phycisphaerales bacterium]